MALYEVVCYEVVGRCGHVGNGNYVSESFAIYGKSRRDASGITSDIQSVKSYNKKDLMDVREILAVEDVGLCGIKEVDIKMRAARLDQNGNKTVYVMSFHFVEKVFGPEVL